MVRNHLPPRFVENISILKNCQPQPQTAHVLEELSEEYAGDINDVAKKLNILGKMVRNPNTNAMALHLFDKSLQ